jgi:methylated-DNA-[protein]-cysteine S-methyltransferase
MSMSYKFMNSPVDVLKLVASEKSLVAVLWENDNPRRVRLGAMVEEPLHPLPNRTGNELNEYFAGRRNAFSIPLGMRDTYFQKQVWETLLGIPFGETRTYGDIAERLGKSHCHTSCRSGQWAKSDFDHRFVPPRHRRVGRVDRLCRGP